MAGNYKIDNGKFGAFLVQLRKEKGLTQKELAQQLYVSDKAVSKWERGLSLPDISLLQPMAEMLDVSVTELLSGRTIREDHPLTVEEVEPLVTGVLTLNTEEAADLREHRRRWGIWLFASILACGLETWLLRRTGLLWDFHAAMVWTPPLLALVFGIYLVFLSKEKLPVFYDQYKLNFVSDGMFRMNVPGVSFNNRNWPHVLNAMRTWACATLAVWLPFYCLVRWAVSQLLPGEQPLAIVLLIFTLIVTLDGLFLPVVVVGRKYE